MKQVSKKFSDTEYYYVTNRNYSIWKCFFSQSVMKWRILLVSFNEFWGIFFICELKLNSSTSDDATLFLLFSPTTLKIFSKVFYFYFFRAVWEFLESCNFFSNPKSAILLEQSSIKGGCGRFRHILQKCWKFLFVLQTF